jgi:ADP-ribosylglycohydrolase
MLLECAIGDAYGRFFEFAPACYVKKFNTGNGYPSLHPRRPPGYLTDEVRGSYTDDTQMSLALAEMIVEDRPWTPLEIAGKFLEVFKRDKRKGYAGGFYQFLKETDDAGAFLFNIRPDSAKTGGAMRATPLCALATIGEVLSKGRIQAAVTHNTSDGMNAAMAASLIAWHFAHGGEKKGLVPLLCKYIDGPWDKPWSGSVGNIGIDAVRAVITSLLRTESLTALLIDCVAYTGDVDTVAAIAMAAASFSPEYERDLNPSLYADLERGTYGYDYLEELDKKLLSRLTEHKVVVQ